MGPLATEIPRSPAAGPWLEEAEALADQLRGHALRAEGGALVWLHPGAEEPPERLGPRLYSGFTGIALFFAARAWCGGGLADRRMALETLAPLRSQLRRLVASADLARDQAFRLGALVGLGGYVYAFVRIGEWLQDDDLLAEAHGVSSLLTPERIAADERLDVAHGVAGALLALLALDRVRPEANRAGATPLELATACGERLLARRDRTGGWRAEGKLPMVGFAHGATGIACALLALAGRTGRGDFRAAADAGLDFERTLFDPDRGAWQVSPEVPRYWMSWCNGAAGIALGRLAMLGATDDPQVAGEARNALAALRSAPPTPAEHLCCGNLGRVDAFLEAARLLGEEVFATAATDAASAVFARTRERDRGYAWSERIGRYGFDPSFFRGSAGAGYTALRCADPTLPCILRME